MSAIPDILRKNNYIIHTYDWEEPFTCDDPMGPMISVAERIGAIWVKQLVNIGIQDGKIRFYSGNGYTAILY